LRNLFTTPDAVAAMIRDGATLVVAGAEPLLAGLPRGNWIGGTTAYFITDRGGVVDSSNLYCSVLDDATDCRIDQLRPDSLARVTARRFAGGYSYLLLPAQSEVHLRYAVEAPSYPGLYEQPVVGWIAGVHLDDLGKTKAKVFDGSTGEMHDDVGVVLHVAASDRVVPELDIINMFVQGDGPAIVFPRTGFTVNACTIDGRAATFADLLRANDNDMRLPLVANYAGAMINVSLQSIDAITGDVALYAPVVAGETYRLARPIDDIAATYVTAVGDHPGAGTALSCNCILNFLYAKLEGARTGGFVGPVTFGELAYILVNQTLVHLSLVPATAPAALQPA
jgi:hypothetical protein